MELDQIRNCYRLKPIAADPRSFLLDPHNPRIALLLEDPSILNTRVNLASEAVQKAVINVLKRPEFELHKLIASIRQKGFSPDGSQMIVKKIGDNYQVLEGNRRTAAIRSLLGEPSLMSPSVRDSVRSIDVQEFTFMGARDGISERDVIEMILGQIHISGKLSWGAMERADYIYQSFCRLADVKASELWKFGYDVSTASRVAETFDSSTKDVRKNIMIARNYMLLRKIGADVNPQHYTLIDLATATRSVRESLFELSDEYFHFSEKGAEKFARLCVEEDRIIRNPDDFRVFSKVAASGDEDFLKSVISGSQTLEEADERLGHDANREKFERQVRRALEIVSELPLDSYRGNQEEKKLILRLMGVVDSRLKPLLKA
jgi:hypothetical protein